MMIKFCILTTQRSGSTWLKQLLDSHPQVKALGEPFLWRKERPGWKDTVIDYYYNYKTHNFGIRPWIIFQYLNLLNSYPGDHQAIGFKLMYNQLVLRPEILVKLALDGYKVIHLVRENYLDIAISRASRKKNNVAHLESENKIKIKPVTLDISRLLTDIFIQENMQKKAKKLLNILPLPVLEITYDSLYRSRDKTLSFAANFLGIQSSGIIWDSQNMKINKGDYRQKIANFEEVKNVLAGTKFEKLLNECSKVSTIN